MFTPSIYQFVTAAKDSSEESEVKFGSWEGKGIESDFVHDKFIKDVVNSKMKSTKVQTLGELRMRGTANGWAGLGWAGLTRTRATRRLMSNTNSFSVTWARKIINGDFAETTAFKSDKLPPP